MKDLSLRAPPSLAVAAVECDVVHTSTSVATFNFAVAPTASQYRVVIHG